VFMRFQRISKMESFQKQIRCDFNRTERDSLWKKILQTSHLEMQKAAKSYATRIRWRSRAKKFLTESSSVMTWYLCCELLTCH
jgi:hypothetical protein